MLLILAHILLIAGIYCTAWGLRLPPVSSVKKAALHAFGPTFWGLFMIGASGCMLYGALFEGKYWFS